MRIDLKCPYQDKDVAKSLGARWDAAQKTWYIEDMEDLTPFMQWIPSHRTNPPTSKREPNTISLREYVAGAYGKNIKALSFAAAKAFRVPYPLESGWFEKYANNTIPFDYFASALRERDEKSAKHPGVGKKQNHSRAHKSQKRAHTATGKVWATTNSTPVASCNCDVLPWEDCEHTDRAAHKAMQEMLSLTEESYMRQCKCGGTIRQHKLTETPISYREAWTCNSCGRYEQITRAIPESILKTLEQTRQSGAAEEPTRGVFA